MPVWLSSRNQPDMQDQALTAFTSKNGQGKGTPTLLNSISAILRSGLPGLRSCAFWTAAEIGTFPENSPHFYQLDQPKSCLNNQQVAGVVNRVVKPSVLIVRTDLL